ncbi:MAG: hypothetical protein AAFQ94_05615 [Bacteroidota bacterium]
MSENIPEYIGSRLGAIEEETESSEINFLNMTDTVSDAENDEKPIIYNNTQIKPVMEKKKKPLKKPVGRKRKTGASKTLPKNPGAATTELVLEDLNLSEQNQEAELPELNLEIPQESDAEASADLAKSLKSLPGKKKTTTKKAPVRKKAKPVAKKLPTPATKKPVTEEIEPLHLELSTQEEEITTAIPNSKASDQSGAKEMLSKTEMSDSIALNEKPKEIVIDVTKDKKPSPKATPVNKTRPQKKASPAKKTTVNNTEANERKAYVKKIKEETRAFLKQLTVERKRREAENKAARLKRIQELKGN